MFEVKSDALKNGETLPNEQVLNGFGCTGGNVSPDLSWSGYPTDTKSFAIICHDPDAPRPNGWYHWLIINIPQNITSIKSGEKLSFPSTETLTDFGTCGYGGACPPVGHGVHRYNFKILALDIEHLEIDKNTPPKKAEEIISKHIIDEALITALYQR